MRMKHDKVFSFRLYDHKLKKSYFYRIVFDQKDGFYETYISCRLDQEPFVILQKDWISTFNPFLYRGYDEHSNTSYSCIQALDNELYK